VADPIATGFKLTQFFNEGIFGWSETLYWAKEGGLFGDVIDDVRTLNNARRRILASTAALVGTRISTFGSSTTGAYLDTAAADNHGPGLVPSEATDTPVWNGLLLRMVTDDALYKRSLIVRGLPPSWIQWSKEATPGLTDIGRKQMNAYQSLLANSGLAGNRSKLLGIICLHGRSFTLKDTKAIGIDAAVPSADGCGTILTVDLTTDYKIGDKIHIGKATGCGTKGLNGDGLVTKLPTGNTIQVSNKPCCCGPYDYKPTGVLSKILYFLYANTGCVDSRVVERDTGRPFFGTRGRRRTCSR
jgi:hypothetical protein